MVKGGFEMKKIGIDIGGTFIKYALVDESYKIMEKWKVETIKFETKDELYDYICHNMRGIEDIDVIGISAPGVIDEEANVRSYAAPNLRIMYGTNIVHEIQNRTNDSNYRYKKKSPETFDILQRIGDESLAIKHAQRLRESFSGTDYAAHKPCTTVYELVEELTHPEKLL